MVEFGGHNPFTIVFLKKSLPTLCDAFIVDFFPQNWRVFSTVLFCRTLLRQAGTHRLGSRLGADQVSGCRRPTRKNDVMGFEATAFLDIEPTEFTVDRFAPAENDSPFGLANRSAAGLFTVSRRTLPAPSTEQTDSRVDQVGTASLAQRVHRDQQPCPCLGAHRVGAPVDAVDDSPMHLSRASASRASRADYRPVNCPSRNCQPRDLLLQIKSFRQYKRVADRNEERVKSIRRR